MWIFFSVDVNCDYIVIIYCCIDRNNWIWTTETVMQIVETNITIRRQRSNRPRHLCANCFRSRNRCYFPTNPKMIEALNYEKSISSPSASCSMNNVRIATCSQETNKTHSLNHRLLTLLPAMYSSLCECHEWIHLQAKKMIGTQSQ